MKKDRFHAKVAFFLSLGFWIPLFNIPLCITSLIIGIPALKRIMKNPKYGGLTFAIIAVVLALTSIVLSVIGLVYYTFSDTFCNSAVCERLTQ